jgi:hypothetical protein
MDNTFFLKKRKKKVLTILVWGTRKARLPDDGSHARDYGLAVIGPKYRWVLGFLVLACHASRSQTATDFTQPHDKRWTLQMIYLVLYGPLRMDVATRSQIFLTELYAFAPTPF